MRIVHRFFVLSALFHACTVIIPLPLLAVFSSLCTAPCSTSIHCKRPRHSSLRWFHCLPLSFTDLSLSLQLVERRVASQTGRSSPRGAQRFSPGVSFRPSAAAAAPSNGARGFVGTNADGLTLSPAGGRAPQLSPAPYWPAGGGQFTTLL